jgi:hypothetical protein
MQSLPKYLYRGDSDPKKERMLKATFESCVLMTNLCNGGNGREIFSNPLGNLINKHISVGWYKTHFLSFSAEERTAFYYGSNDTMYEEVYEEKAIWDFAVFTFDTTLLIPNSIKEIESGIFSAQFIPSCKEFLPFYKVIIIDAFSHLKSISDKNGIELNTAIAKADKDKEWLILPAVPFGNEGELSSKLDTHCISDKRVFRFD